MHGQQNVRSRNLQRIVEPSSSRVKLSKIFLDPLNLEHEKTRPNNTAPHPRRRESPAIFLSEFEVSRICSFERVNLGLQLPVVRNVVQTSMVEDVSPVHDSTGLP